MQMPSLFMTLDPYLIWFYRLPDNPYAGLLLGTFVLALICLVLGEITLFLTSSLLGQHLGSVADEAAHYQDLSIQAAKAGDKASFKAANKIANEAFGKSFFSLMAVSMARLWPAPFALAWMQYRFLDLEVPIPGTGFSIGFVGVFIFVYIITMFLIKKLKQYLPRLRRLTGIRGASLSAADLPKIG